MNTHNIYFHGEKAKYKNIMKKNHVELSSFIKYLDLNSHHAMGRFRDNKLAIFFFLENRF